VPIQPADHVEPPTHDGWTESMQQAWQVMVDDLRARGMLDSADSILIERAAVMWGRAIDAMRLVGEQGYLVDLVKGEGTKLHPALALERESSKELRFICEHLPLSRSARNRLGLGAKQENHNPFAPPTPIRSVK
jgi:P27 family predicted phage terminase small subunit